MKKIFSIVSGALIVIIAIFLFSLVVKGDKGDPIAFQEIKDTRVEGPFESTNSNSRYALVESIVNQGTFLFDDNKARFAAPDLVEQNGRFFSIFTPGVSFVGIPFYMLGKYLGLPQLFTYFSTHLFALLNVLLIAFLTIRLGGKIYHGLLSGLVFLFGTNALSYALTFTQHQASTFIILLGILNALGKRSLVSNILFGAIYGAGILMDIPNAFLLLPVGLYILYKNFNIEILSEKVKLGVKLGILGLVIGVIPFLALYGWYNYQTAGSYTAMAQFIGRSDYPKPLEEIEFKDSVVEEKNPQPKLLEVPFNTRLQLNGLYILLVSNERGIFYFSPLLLIGALGLFIAYRLKQYKTSAVLVFSVISMNIILYSLFGDPWGGWSFGPRYLIPATALLSAGVGVAVWRFVRNPIFIVVFLTLLVYSVGVAFLGALTTNAIPPKVEAINLIDPIPYTYEYNLQFINLNKSSSLLYNFVFYNIINLRYFWLTLSGAVISLISILFAYSFIKDRSIRS